MVIATVLLFVSCDSYKYKSVYSVNDENGNILFTDTVYIVGTEYSQLVLSVDDENYYRLIFDRGFESALLIKSKQKVDIISFEQLNKVE